MDTEELCQLATKLTRAQHAIERLAEAERPAWHEVVVEAIERCGWDDVDKEVQEAAFDRKGMEAALEGLLPAEETFMELVGIPSPHEYGTLGHVVASTGICYDPAPPLDQDLDDESIPVTVVDADDFDVRMHGLMTPQDEDAELSPWLLRLQLRHHSNMADMDDVATLVTDWLGSNYVDVMTSDNHQVDNLLIRIRLKRWRNPEDRGLDVMDGIGPKGVVTDDHLLRQLRRGLARHAAPRH